VPLCCCWREPRRIARQGRVETLESRLEPAQIFERDGAPAERLDITRPKRHGFLKSSKGCFRLLKFQKKIATIRPRLRESRFNPQGLGEVRAGLWQAPQHKQDGAAIVQNIGPAGFFARAAS
jgi:hypothetical protein